MATTSGGSILWDLDIEDAKFVKRLADAKSQIDSTAAAGEKRFNSLAKNIADSMENAARSLDQVGDSLLKIGAAPTAAFGIAIKRATDFETSMSNISTLISGDSTKAIAGLSDEVLKLSKRMPKSIDELGGSLYDILSAGVEGAANQMKVLESSAKLATAGLGDTKGATDIMTSAINAFGLDASKSNKIADILFKTVKFGKTTVDQLSMSFGATAPVIAAAGVSLEEYSAATAALTTTGLPASQSQNALRQAVVALQKPTKEMAEIFAKAGIASGDVALKQDGLVKVMQKVTKAAGGNQEALAKAWGSVEALGAATALTGQVNESFVGTLKSMKSGSEALTEAFNKQTDTTAAQLALMKNRFDAIAITVGKVVLPVINDFLKQLTPLVEKFADFINKNPELVRTLFFVTAAVTGLGLAFKGASLVLGTIAPLIGIIGSVSLPVVAILGALAGAGYLIYQNWGLVVGIFNKVVDVFKGFFELIQTDDIAHFSTALENLGINSSKISQPFGILAGHIRDFIDKMKQLPDIISGVYQLIANGDYTGKLGRALGISEDSPLIANILNFRQKIIDLFDKLKLALTDIGNILKGALGPVWDTFVEAIKRSIPELKTLAEDLGPLLINSLKILAGIVAGLALGFLTMFVSLAEGLSFALPFIIKIFDGIVRFLTGVMDIIIGIFTLNLDQIKKGFVNIFTGIGNIIYGTFGSIISFIVGFVKGVIDVAQSLYNALIGHSIIPDLINGMYNLFKNGLNNIFNFIKNIFISIQNAIMGPVNAVRGQVQSAMEGMYSAAASAWSRMLSFFSGLGSSIVNAIVKPFQDALSYVSRIAQQIKDAANKINPFYRSSPSLVDNVTRGLDIIRKEFASLNDIQLPGVSIGRQFQFSDQTSGTLPPASADNIQTTNSSNIVINNYIDKIAGMDDINALDRKLGFQLATQ